MCGIVGAVGCSDVTKFLVTGLRRLEYRGYDSAGIAVFDKNHELKRLRAVGKINMLAELVEKHPLTGDTGIAHTRWATHGIPTEQNAHPHVSVHKVFLVHNGIIENHEELRERLLKLGYEFVTETDTEVIAHLVHYYCDQGEEFLQAVAKTVKELVGAYALAIMHKDYPGRIIVARYGSPAVLGLGDGQNYIASDALALLSVTNKFIYLDEGDIADVTKDKITIYDQNLHEVVRPIKASKLTQDQADLNGYTHFMEKEIFEQPQAIAETLAGRVAADHILPGAFGLNARKKFNKIKGIRIVACGSSYHAALVGCYWLEKLSGVPCRAEIASEYRYRNVAVEPDTLFITISQSGETADTLAALRKAKQLNYLSNLTICNVPDSSLVRESDMIFMTRAGIEVGVATTKAFTTQLIALLLLALELGTARGLNSQAIADLVKNLQYLPKLTEAVLAQNKQIKALSKFFLNKQHVFFLGRDLSYPVVMEGALKLKEISYIHAEAYPAGELKHGPLALIEPGTPIVAVMPNDGMVDKLKSNLHEVKTRFGEIIIFADETLEIPDSLEAKVLKIPQVTPDLAPIIYTLPLQLLAYHVAIYKGTDVDKPRNLAKSVTVE